MPERIFLTGATGFIGSAVARAFLNGGYEVRALVRSHSNTENIDGLPIERCYGSLENISSFQQALEGCTGLVHTAADYRFFVPDPDHMRQVNVDSTLSLFEAAFRYGVKRMIYTSSVATLGYAEKNKIVDETYCGTREEMIGIYKETKYLAETHLLDLIRKKHLNASIVNPTAPVGPRDIKPTPTGRMVFDAARGRMPAYIETGLNIVHVDDVALGHVLAYERGKIGERYILGGENLMLADILRSITQLTGKSPPRLKLSATWLMPVAWLSESWSKRFGGIPLVTRDELAMAKHIMFFSSQKAKNELGYSSRPAISAFTDAIAWANRRGYPGT